MRRTEMQLSFGYASYVNVASGFEKKKEKEKEKTKYHN